MKNIKDMKRVFQVFAIISLLSAFLISCKQKSAEEVAEKFAVAYHNLDFATAKSLATENSIKQLDMFAQMAEGMPRLAKDEAKKVVITMGKGQETGDRATYFYTPSDNDVPQKINLIKVNGEWKVEWNKEDNIDKDLLEQTKKELREGSRENLPNEEVNIHVEAPKE
jgi:hypothetical protein